MQRRNFLAAPAAAALGPTATFAAESPGSGSPPFASRFARSARHTTHYWDAGPPDGPAIVFVHGWPEVGLAWRHALHTLPALGFRVLAPDLRGTGRSAVYRERDAYAQRQVVADMIELADQAGIERALWVGHDWGAPVVWNVASHHPSRCHGVAALCVPYDTLERGLARIGTLVDRRLYPAAEFPYGQYDYIAFYQEHFDDARAVFDANVEGLLKVLLRRGDPSLAGQRFPTANVRRQGGWFGPGRPPPAVPLDTGVLDEATLAAYVEAYQRTGFNGINALYMNDADNAAYADAAVRGGVLELPALFLGGRYDWVNDPVGSPITEPMKAKCRDLTTRLLACGHWMQNEKPAEVNAALLQWIAARVPMAWPQPRTA